MTRIERSVDIDAPVEDVFAFASDWKNWTKFFVGVSDFGVTTETQRGNGARYLYKASLMGMKAMVETEIHDFVENERWTGIATRGIPHKTHWLFKPVDGGTHFTYILEYRLPIPLIGGLLNCLFLRPQWEKILEKSLANLKERMER
jgi:uncharacterized membrane protein